MSESLEGLVERITYYNEETGYTVIRVRPERVRLSQVGKDGFATVVGTLPELQPGESVRFVGAWTSHSDYGLQFRADAVEQKAPATIEGLRRYLGSGLIKGVGPVTAGRIVDHFGLDTLAVLDTLLEEGAERLLAVPGVGKQRANRIARAWVEQKHIKAIMLFLQTHGVNTTLAVRIYKTYGDEAIARVKQDPYQLAQDIYGIGFKTADQIALHLGLPFTSPARVEAGLVFALNEWSEEGHVYATRDEAVAKAAALLGVPDALCADAVDRLRASDRIVVERVPGSGEAGAVEALYLPPFYHSEKGAAARLNAMSRLPASRLSRARELDWTALFGRLDQSGGMQLTDQQKDAVRAALQEKVTILTGGPGTGKTTTLRAVIAALETAQATYALASPTGRAAKRLSEATGKPAQTIHRLLGIQPGAGFAHDEETPLNVDMLVLDEVSMLDQVLFYQVLKALRADTHLVLVGDVDQLPSVGAGDVLRALVESRLFRVTRLATIFRQAASSLIIRNAHRIQQGEMPDLANKGLDFFMFAADTPEAAADLVVEVVKTRIPRRFGMDALEDVQVLSPMYRGAAGVGSLNQRLQEALNPARAAADPTSERLIAGRLFRAGDKVIQLRNNYDKEVFNGDMGRVERIDPLRHTLTVRVDGRAVEYDFADAGELTHAYAISVHRSQGSEYPAVVLPVLTQHFMMLQRNLLYTAVTRARKLVVLVGTRKAIAIAVRNNLVARRHTALAWRLREGRA